LATIAGKKFTFAEAFKLVDDILYKAVKGITDIILVPGLVNVDFADVKTIMEDGGKALIGVGVGQGETKVEDAVKEAINSPLLDGTSIEGARRLLINLEISPDLTYEDVQEAVDQIRNKAHQDAHIIFGANLNMNIENEMRITVVATDFEEESVKLREKIIDSLQIKANHTGTLNFTDTLKLSTNNPIEKFDKKRISIFDKDTIAVNFTLRKENHNKLIVLFDKKEQQTYKIKVFPNAITDFFNQQNKDTLQYSLRTKKKDNYGSISLKFTNPKQQAIIVQLLDTNENIIAQRKKITNNTTSFEFLNPAKYLIRIIVDKNKNGIWDTGNYLKKIQPERVIYFKKEIEVKENWFVNETIDIK